MDKIILYGQAEDAISSTDITNNKYIIYYKRIKRGILIRPGLLWFPKSCKEFPAQISKIPRLFSVSRWPAA